MSYDLYLRPRNGPLGRAAFEAHFEKSALFEKDGAEVAYHNEATGTYFTFGWRDIDAMRAEGDEPEPDYPILFNINFFRPSSFAMEAAPHVTALVRALDLVVSDPQTNGMGEGEFSVEGFFSGWNAGNEWAISRFAEEHSVDEYGGLLPQAEIHRTWLWNLKKAQRRAALEQLGIDRFVPTRMYARVDGSVASMIVWPDGIPFESAPTDYVLVIRDAMAPRTFLRSRPDKVLVRWSDLHVLIERHASFDPDGVVAFTYDKPPKDVATFLKRLPACMPDIKVLSPDRVLDAEHAPASLVG
ncbi:hypothetical protein [Lysobacter soli]|uniref:hypothetical protein n=1 Tax=Lysobacter soli TaxID=453783 RepID=UPI00240FE1CA|nr:hypothetical protein [Lysobacter soli]MDG2519344.1 hypothetical protein [Lysobacter soli]